MGNRILRSAAASFVVLLMLASGSFAAMGDLENFTFNGFGETDLVSPGEVNQPDGKPDARFTVNISGIGALSGLVLRSDEHDGVWDTIPGNGIWGMHVKDSSGNVLTESSGRLPLVPFLLGMGLEFFVADNGAIARGGKFTLTARFVDNSESSATINIEPSWNMTGSEVSLLSARWGEKGPRDLTGRSENIRGDGVADDRIRLELDGRGTLVSVEVRDIVEGNPTAAWDTIPGNGRWAIAVVQGERLVNRSDGSIELPISGRSTLDLWMTDNGVIAAGRSRFEVVLKFSNGQSLMGMIGGMSGGSEDIEAAFAGEGDRDITGPNEKLAGNGKNDWRVDVGLNSVGTVVAMKIANVNGSSGEWDTIPGNGKWLLGVTQPNGSILNRSDGSVRFPVRESGDLVLWLENNGSLDKADTRSVLTVIYDDGRMIEKEISPYTAASGSGRHFLDARHAGVGNADHVGKDENLRGNMNRDNRFDIRFTAKGIMTSIRLVNTVKGGEWDTIPGNGKWLMAVKQPGGSILNAPDGSIRLSVDGTVSMELWVEDNGTLGDDSSAYRISLVFSDGSVLEKEIPARTAVILTAASKRALVLSRPWQASSSDYVGPYDRLQKNGKNDWVFPLKIEGKGTIKTLTLKNTGLSGEWDTIPGNGKWTLAVRGPGNLILNRSDGSVSFPVPPNHNLYLFVENNGTLQLSNSGYELTATWDDGTTSTARVQ